MISGHRRLHAAKMAGLTTIPAIVRELSDDDAVIAMVDANIQREELLPSEKAFKLIPPYDEKRRLEAKKKMDLIIVRGIHRINSAKKKYGLDRYFF